MTEYRTEQHEGATVISVHGRLDLLAARGFKDVVHRTVDDGARLVVVDLAPTEFMDSSGLGAVVAGLKAARQRGGDLRLANVGGQVGLVLELTNLDRVLRPYPSVEDAVRGGG